MDAPGRTAGVTASGTLGASTSGAAPERPGTATSDKGCRRPGSRASDFTNAFVTNVPTPAERIIAGPEIAVDTVATGSQ
jgi:hypothetical protein